mmetsp:Transcript_102282/g.324983  ORF Transcript_102282/g.324983 Transcript_102282/m.324983 type:complete len:316 (+) Transcript_102282:97-1044(+)
MRASARAHVRVHARGRAGRAPRSMPHAAQAEPGGLAPPPPPLALVPDPVEQRWPTGWRRAALLNRLAARYRAARFWETAAGFGRHSMPNGLADGDASVCRDCCVLPSWPPPAGSGADAWQDSWEVPVQVLTCTRLHSSGWGERGSASRSSASASLAARVMEEPSLLTSTALIPARQREALWSFSEAEEESKAGRRASGAASAGAGGNPMGFGHCLLLPRRGRCGPEDGGETLRRAWRACQDLQRSGLPFSSAGILSAAVCWLGGSSSGGGTCCCGSRAPAGRCSRREAFSSLSIRRPVAPLTVRLLYSSSLLLHA